MQNLMKNSEERTIQGKYLITMGAVRPPFHKSLKFLYPAIRCTVFSNYAKLNCPADDAKLPTLCKGDGSTPSDSSAKSGPYWSLMFEVSESQYKPVNQEPLQLGGKTW